MRSRPILVAATIFVALTAVAMGFGPGRAFWQLVKGTTTPPDRIAMIRERHLPNVRLTDHEGRTHLFYDNLVRGKAVAINFMYASCSKTCEVASQNLSRLQDELGARLGRQVSLYSITLDPEHDTPEALAAYRQHFGAKPGWTFLKPDSTADVTMLRRKLGVYEIDPAVDAELSLSNHTGIVVLGNEPSGRWTMIPSLLHPVRIRQAIERILLPPEQWARGDAVVQEVPREDSDAGLSR